VDFKKALITNSAEEQDLKEKHWKGVAEGKKTVGRGKARADVPRNLAL
jgi:hypothetical protein